MSRYVDTPIEDETDLPSLPDGQEWRLVEEIVVGDRIPGGGVVGEVTAVAPKPKTVWLYVRISTPFGETTGEIRPKRGDRLAVLA